MIVQTCATLTSPDQKLITKICTPLNYTQLSQKKRSTNHLMSINFGIPPYPPEKLQKAEGKKERREKFTKKIRKIHNPRKTNPKEKRTFTTEQNGNFFLPAWNLQPYNQSRSKHMNKCRWTQ
ncbi:hypothetical protein RIR_jg21496.t1 [Rhizophagus irregularis DAOM 181602=DAOM 197198]|nr:hypothetical protein RIR_jg21496.t1 [Rhizophagus irregularis DAOM 181602=DAOM 197198]